MKYNYLFILLAMVFIQCHSAKKNTSEKDLYRTLLSEFKTKYSTKLNMEEIENIIPRNCIVNDTLNLDSVNIYLHQAIFAENETYYNSMTEQSGFDTYFERTESLVAIYEYLTDSVDAEEIKNGIEIIRTTVPNSVKDSVY